MMDLEHYDRAERATKAVRERHRQAACSDDGPEPCPMGCGNLTHDPGGGPCDQCWDDLYANPKNGGQR